MEYMHIVTRALAISWRHKYLWLLALLAGEATTIGGGFGGSGGGHQSHGYNYGPNQVTWTQVTTWVSAHAALLWTAGITVALLGIVLFLLSAVANGALVKGSAEHDAERPFSLRQAWAAGLHTFGPVLRLRFFALIVGASVAIVIGGLALMTFVFALSHTVVAAILTGALAATLLLAVIPFFIVFGVTVLLGVRAIVLDGKGASDGLRSGLDLIWRRRGRVALFWLLVIVAGWIATTVVTLALVVVALPLVGITAAAYLSGGWALAVVAGIALGAVWLAVALTLLGGIRAFTSTCWTLAYSRFDLQPQPAVSAQPQPA